MEWLFSQSQPQCPAHVRREVFITRTWAGQYGWDWQKRHSMKNSTYDVHLSLRTSGPESSSRCRPWPLIGAVASWDYLSRSKITISPGPLQSALFTKSTGTTYKYRMVQFGLAWKICLIVRYDLLQTLLYESFLGPKLYMLQSNETRHCFLSTVRCVLVYCWFPIGST